MLMCNKHFLSPVEFDGGSAEQCSIEFQLCTHHLHSDMDEKRENNGKHQSSSASVGKTLSQLYQHPNAEIKQTPVHL